MRIFVLNVLVLSMGILCTGIQGRLSAAVEKEACDFRIRLDMSDVKEGATSEWKVRTEGGQENFSYDAKTGTASFCIISNWQGIFRDIELPPGHYMMRGLAKTNSFAPRFYAQDPSSRMTIFHIPLGISEDFKEVVLPFYVEGGGKEKKKISIGIAKIYADPSRHEAIVSIKDLEIIRLGDTVLEDNWLSKCPVSPNHGLETLKKIARPDRPGRVIFHDSMTGAEIWLLTQGGEVNMSYAGNPDFSNDGKYLHAGAKRPGDVVRTDGSFRYKSPGSTLLWLFPWEQKRLPSGTDASDWIASLRYKSIYLFNLVTGEKHEISLPVKEGWEIRQTPSKGGGRGPNIKEITYETLVWQSEDRKQFALSDIEGNNFRTFKVKSISKNPEKDIIYPAGDKGLDTRSINSVWGKSGNNWANAVDREGTRYFVFDINRNSFFTDENPYQVWMLPLSLDDKRGLLRVIPNPRVKQVPGVGKAWRGDSWWNLATGLPNSGDNAILLLEDGTYVHMNSLGMHTFFRRTASVNSVYDNSVRFIGNFPSLVDASWEHEFIRDKGFAILWSRIVPPTPVIMMDMEHDTLWTVSMMNYTDLEERLSAASKLRSRTAAKLIYPYANPSPDFTKACYASSMLTLGNPEYEYGDAYITVARYPQPPVDLRLEGNRLAWTPPPYNAEIKGYNLYRSGESGMNYEKVNREPLEGNSCEISRQEGTFYVMTSVEHSGLESRMFSSEVYTQTPKTYRLFYEAETGDMKSPMVPFFEPVAASNAYAAAVTDPELLYRRKLESGLKGSVVFRVSVPVTGKARIMARIRGMSRIECSSYTTGWPEKGEPGKGAFSIKVDGKDAGKIPVEKFGWKWMPLGTKSLSLAAGEHTVEFETPDAGIAVDNILVTNDIGFVPAGSSNTPSVPPSAPSGLKVAEQVVQGKDLEWEGYSVKPPYLKLTWNASKAPQGVRYYNIYRSENMDFNRVPATQVGSSNDPVFVDTCMEVGKRYFYSVEAVDNWNNRSAGSTTLAATIKLPGASTR